jgi:hypothetical protein
MEMCKTVNFFCLLYYTHIENDHVNTVKPVHNGLCPQRKPVINGHFVKNTSFFMVFVWNRTCTQRKLSITSELFPPEQIFVQTNLFTTNFPSTFFCSQVKNQV